jgi:hypothetical protein
MNYQQPLSQTGKSPGLERLQPFRSRRGKSAYTSRLMPLRSVYLLFASVLVCSVATTQAQDLRVIDFPYTPTAMSGDGNYFISGPSRIDMDLNQVDLGDLAGGGDSTSVRVINFDGSICAGYSDSEIGREAFLWTEESGMVGLGFLVTRISGLSDHGLAIVGTLSYDNDYAPFYWSLATGLIQLTEATSVNGLSADGTVVLGVKALHGFSWTLTDGYIDIGRLHGSYGPPSDQLAISADGTTIVGRSYYEAFRWTEATGIVGLGDLRSEEDVSSHATDASADGSVVVGWAGTDATYDGDNEAMMWNQTDGMVSLNTLLTESGVTLGGLSLDTVLFVSDDGRKMLAMAVDPYWDNHLCYIDLDAETTEPPAPLHKLAVVNRYRRMWEYELDGSLIGQNTLDTNNDAPKGATANESGTTWVIDDTDNVFVYDEYGSHLGNWKVSGLSRPEGIAVLGQDLLIIDRGLDKVLVFEGAATWLDGRTASASSSWSLATSKGNKNARGISTDGTYVWVVNTARTDRIYQYSIDGTYLSRFNLDAGANNKNPRGVSVSQDGSTLSVVDITSDTVYFYSAADPGLGSFDAFPLNSGNSKPEGIAEVIVP